PGSGSESLDFLLHASFPCGCGTEMDNPTSFGFASLDMKLVFYQFKQLMGAATQWFLSLLGFSDTFWGRGHCEQGPQNSPPGAPSDSPTRPPQAAPSSP